MTQKVARHALIWSSCRQLTAFAQEDDSVSPAAKLSLVAGFLVLAKLGMGYVQAGAWTAAFHGPVLAVIAGLALWGSLRHRGPVGNAAHGASDRASVSSCTGRRPMICLRALTFGREGRFRELMLRPAKLQPGEAVLDVACGTGTLAIAAKRLVRSDGSVTGVDASAEMIERRAPRPSGPASM